MNPAVVFEGSYSRRTNVPICCKCTEQRELPLETSVDAERVKESRMTENIENLLLEHMKRLQAVQPAARDRDVEILSRLASIESGIARLARDEASTYSEPIQDRHGMDKLKERIERIEKRLELAR